MAFGLFELELQLKERRENHKSVVELLIQRESKKYFINSPGLTALRYILHCDYTAMIS